MNETSSAAAKDARGSPGLRTNRWERVCLVVLAGAYVVWAGLFIYQSSYVALDGQRYFGLFDDAMISMRYAWNFAHGLGLVWNAGEHVEGYSNLLMTLGMSLAALVFDKKLAVLAVQIAGIPTVLIAAFLSRRFALEINAGGPLRELIGLLVFAAVLAYYPLSYWTLMGMETGLLTLFILACSWFGWRSVRTGKTSDLLGMSLFGGLAFLTRNDALILSALVFAYVAIETYGTTHDARRLRAVVYAALLLLLFVIGQTIFRLAYYGVPLPNTYTLKLTGIPLNVRLIGGTRFVLEFLRQSWLLLALAAIAVLIEWQSVRLLLFSLILAAVAYQIYIGGDPWQSWRLLAPAMPGAFVLASTAIATLFSNLPAIAPRRYLLGTAVILVMLAALTLADLPFLADMTVRGPTSAAIANRVNTNSAIAIDALTLPGASVGVIWAGTLPYYAGRPAVDFLGKSDPHIASLPADVSGAVSWGGMISVPGHNKYDLEYSIVQLRPTYIQAYAWGYDTVKPWVVENYVRVEYHDVNGSKTIFLQKDSPLVCWEACKDQYKIIPWPAQK